MASSWTTYTPPSPSTRDVKSSNLVDNSHTVPSESVTSDASLVCTEMPHVLGRAKSNPSVSSVAPFTLTNESNAESASKAAPIFVSATSFGVKFREAGSPALSSVDLDKQHASTPLPAPHSPVSIDAEQTVPTSDGAGIAAAHLVGPILPMHQQVVKLQSPSSSSMFERDAFASLATKSPQAVAPISAADNVTPPSPSNPTTPYPISTGDISPTDSPNSGAPRSPTVNLTLTGSPEPGRGKPDRQPPKRSVTTGTAGTGSIVQSQYTDMVFEEVPRTHNLLSGLFTWILLAGFVVLPGTFSALEGIQSNSGEFEKVLHTIRHLPLYVHFFRPVGSRTMDLLLWHFVNGN